MKSIISILCFILLNYPVTSQPPSPASDVIEGGKVVVELIKAISQKREKSKEPDCKDLHGNLCIINESQQSIAVSLFHRELRESRDLLIQASLKECSLHVPVGVWSYDLKISGTHISIRKGDILLESCQDLAMHIRF